MGISGAFAKPLVALAGRSADKVPPIGGQETLVFEFE